ncbi:hypothetical protein [Croceicoccus sp. YJ47]|uniref:hypothetical protein n=1 Tax=Croceicoccus sp. YJ47 TaxID=2798724 RepID=UPI001923B575|nr:hypothetical protein [Croceicoccus sp. YJ47]QQN73975.1 hypothetical protein JD971_14700 [Croceicoccus sp. YJ47]
MGFRKPFKAVPIRLGAHYRRKARAEQRKQSLRTLAIAALVGLTIGIASVWVS